METHANATLPKYLLNKFSLIDLDRCFEYFSVEIKAIKYGEESITFKLYGSKDAIRQGVKGLYSLINSDYKKHAQIDTQPKKHSSQKIKNSLEQLQNEENYKTHYNRIADRYLKDCLLNDIMPHPEVIDGFVI